MAVVVVVVACSLVECHLFRSEEEHQSLVSVPKPQSPRLQLLPPWSLALDQRHLFRKWHPRFRRQYRRRQPALLPWHQDPAIHPLP